MNATSDAEQAVSQIPPLIATSVVRGSEQGESHGGIYIVDPGSQSVRQMFDWNTGCAASRSTAAKFTSPQATNCSCSTSSSGSYAHSRIDISSTVTRSRSTATCFT
jgi:hypothetical protein